MTDERFKQIMTDLGMPESMSLYLALKQVENEVWQAAYLAATEDAARIAESMANNHGWNYHLPTVGREIAAAIRGK